MISPTTIAVINESTTVSDQAVKDVMMACQTQLDRDYFPIWGRSATMVFVDKTQPIPAGFWAITVLDHSDQAGALGYHDLTAEGLPLAKVFAGDDIKYGLSWSVTFSHELLEMMADPDIDLTVFVPTMKNGTIGGYIFAYENCDAVEDDSLAYDVSGVKVSNFVFPSWFNVSAPAGTQFDFCKKVSQPLEILPGGYIGIFDISNPNQGWTQIQAQGIIPARTLVESKERNSDKRPRLTKREKTTLVKSVK